MLDQENINALRMKRQYLIIKAGIKEYDALFRDMSPVQTLYWCCPGDPPRIVHRTDFPDNDHNQKRRAKRIIVKGRFQNGSVAYIEQAELELFAAIYRKPIKQYTEIEAELIELFEHEGPMNIKLMKEMTGILVKDITPALHELQQAFIVYEDQTDNEWDRGWYLFETEFPDVDLKRYERNDAIKMVLQRFAKLNVLFDIDNVKSYYKLSAKDIAPALNGLVDEGQLMIYGNGEKEKYMLRSDHEQLKRNDFSNAGSVYVLHRNDWLVKSNEHWLKEKYRQTDADVLQYILIDGEFKGAVLGFFKQGPYILTDVVLDIPEDEAAKRKEEILQAVYDVNSSKSRPVGKYMGCEV
jgi:hypothetical protein